jgi:hypothetical protein
MNSSNRSFKRGLKIVVIGWFVSFYASYSQQSVVSPPLPPPPPMALPADTLKPVEEIGTHGNWYKKRDWLLKANEVNNQIQDMALQAEDLRSVFMSKYKTIDKILDDYYVNDGLEQGKIQELFDSVNKYIEKQRKKEREGLEKQTKADATLQGKIEFIENKMSSYKQELEQLKLDMKSIEDLDQSLTERLKRFDEQINVVDQEAEKAAKSVDSLWDVLDDLKAREQYYVLNNDILERVKAIHGYLKDDLLADFDSVIATINDQIAKNKDAIKKLEDKGLIIKDRARRIKQIKMKDLESLEKQKTQQGLDEKKEAEEKAQKEALKGPELWHEKLLRKIREGLCVVRNVFVGVWDAITSYWQKPTPKPTQPTPKHEQGAKASAGSTQPTPNPILPGEQKQPQGAQPLITPSVATPTPVQSEPPVSPQSVSQTPVQVPQSQPSIAQAIPSMVSSGGQAFVGAPSMAIEDIGPIPDAMPAAVVRQ